MAFNKAKLLQEAEKLVSQGKISLAIKQFQAIVERDSSDVSLLNTIGDLYVREKNIPEALNQFRRLADSYTQEGFTVKAIAIYKKISKLEPNSVEVQLKLAELYQVQGLGREARDQYSQAFEYYKKKNYPDRAVEVLQKMVQLEPENPTATARLAMYFEQLGRKEDAAKTYFQTAGLANARNDAATSEASLRKAAELDPHNQQVILLRARMAAKNQHPQETIELLTSNPVLLEKIETKKLLLDAYSALGDWNNARNLMMDVYHANPSDFSPVTSYVALCCDHKEYDAAFDPLSGLSSTLIPSKNTSLLMEALKLIWARTSDHLPTLELILQVAEKTGDVFTVPEVLEALGHKYFKEEQLERAEMCFRRLCERETENQHYRDLLKQVLQKAGKDYALAGPLELSAAEIALEPDRAQTTLQASSPVSGETAAAEIADGKRLRDILANADLFSQYGLQERAIEELDKGLEEFPHAVDLHKRLIDICLTSQPLRAGRAALHLSKIYKERGDTEGFARFEKLARKCFGGSIPPEALAEPAAATPVSTPSPDPGQPAPVPAAELPPSAELKLLPPAERVPETGDHPATPPVEIPLEWSKAGGGSPAELPPDAVAAPTSDKAPEGGETPSGVAAASAPGAEPPAELSEFNYREVHEEINYYLSQGFIEEARNAIKESESKFPDDERVWLLRKIVDSAILLPARHPASAPPAPPEPPPPSPAEIDPSEDLRLLAPSAPTLPTVPEPPSPTPVDVSVDAASSAVPGPAAVPPVTAPPESVAPVGPPMEEPGEEIDLSDEIPSFDLRPEPPPPPTEDWELPTSFAREDPPPSVPAESPVLTGEDVGEGPVHKSLEELPPEAQARHAAESPPERPSFPHAEHEPALAADDRLDDLVSDFAVSLGGVGVPTAPAPPRPEAVPAAPEENESPFHDLLAEFREPGGGRTALDEAETHYSLGVAFREMNLLEEAIGEFQKVVKGSKPGAFPANYLRACSLLAVCFMDKQMPAIAVKWYLRALESPDLDDEGAMSLQYDLGMAYELSGETQKALERLTEVYSQNIDFRDVAEKIKTLQQKV